GESTLRKAGRRRVCRLVHKGRIVGRSSTFENLPKRKQAGLKVRMEGQVIRCVVPRCKGYLGMKLRNQVFRLPCGLTAGGSGSRSRDAPTISRHNKHAAIGALIVL